MELRPGEISFWQQCMVAGLSKRYGSAYTAVHEADRAVEFLRKRLPTAEPPDTGPYRAAVPK